MTVNRNLETKKGCGQTTEVADCETRNYRCVVSPGIMAYRSSSNKKHVRLSGKLINEHNLLRPLILRL